MTTKLLLALSLLGLVAGCAYVCKLPGVSSISGLACPSPVATP